MWVNTMTDDSSNPFSHIHKGLDHMNKPAADTDKMEGLGWGYDAEKMRPEVNGKAKQEGLNLEELETLTYLSDTERINCAIEKVIGTASHDLVALSFRASVMRGSVGVKGRGRADVGKMIGGSTPHISVPTTMQKVRRIFTGGSKGKEEETQREEEWSS